MAFAHGRQTDGIYYGTQDLTAYAETWSVTLTGETADTTTFKAAGAAKTSIRGLNSGAGSVSGYYDAAADQVLFDSLSDGTVDAFTIIPDTQAIGGRCYTGGGLSTSFNLGGSVGGVNTWSFDAEGAPFGRGILLNTSAALTGTVNNASYDAGASSANGGVAVFHFISDDITSATVKIQDSANDSDWADVDSQALAAVNSYATVVTGTIDRYLRFAVTAWSGTSAVVIAAFYRFA